MNFTEQTYHKLAAFERYYDTAIHGDWCPNPGRDALAAMCDALDEHDRKRNLRNFSCASCLLRIVKRCGYLYFADKEERQAAEANGKAEREALKASEAAKPSKALSKKTTADTAKKNGKK